MRAVSVYLVIIQLAVVSFYVLSAIYYPQLYIFFTYEDLYGEWGQFYFFFSCFIFSLLNTLDSSNARYRWFFSLLALASFYTFMEEISWGQRLLNFVSPDFFSEYSYQDETNLHNLLTGPVESNAKTILTYLISIAFFAYGILFPLTLKMQWKPALFFEQWGVVPPSLVLIPAFLAAAICEMEFFSFNEAEVAELLVAMAMAFTAFKFWLDKHSSASEPKKFFAYILLTLFVFGSAYATVQGLLNSPKQKARIESRLSNGYKKFAGRYERYDHYWAIVQVLNLYNTLKPDNTVILRRIAKNYLLLNQPEKATELYNQAVAVGLRRHADDPEDIPSLVSLAKSYHKLKRPEKVRFYAQQAYDIAKQKLEKVKGRDRAYWYYWLAKACEQLNLQPEALKFYRKAHKIKPNNHRYERAYYKKQHLMEKYYDADWI